MTALYVVFGAVVGALLGNVFWLLFIAPLKQRIEWLEEHVRHLIDRNLEEAVRTSGQAPGKEQESK